VRILKESVKEARVALAWHIPSVEHDDIPAIDVLSVVLGHGESSRLYAETRRRRELANDAYAYAYTPRDPGLLMVGAGLRAEKLEAAVTSLLDETFSLRVDLISEEELERARVIILSEAAYQRETVQGQARKLGFFEVVAGDFAFEDTYYARLRTLTRQDVRAAARRYLHAKPAAVIQVPQEADAPDEAAVARWVANCFARGSGGRVRARSAGNLGVERVELAGGGILLLRRESTPVVALRALALGGLRYESSTTQGLGHLFASLWGQSTGALSVEAMAHRVALLGGHVSAFAGRNSIGLRGEFIRECALAGTELFLDALLHRSFAGEDLERERAVILERIRNRDDNPAVAAFDAFAKALFPRHPYGLRSVGTEDTVSSFTPADVQAYADQLAGADKLVVAVCGDIDLDATADVLAARLRSEGSLPLPDPPERDRPPEQCRQVRYPLDKQQAHLMVGSMGTTVDNPRRHALEVLTTILSGQSGRLFLDLRDRQSLAYAISSSSLEGLDPGHVLVHVGTSPDKVGQALDGVYGHLARLRDEDVDTDELERAKRYLVGTHGIDLQRGGARAMLMALGELFGLGFDQYSHYAEEVQRVSVDDVRAAAQEYLAPSRLVEAIVGP
jgi:zinc protease